MHYISVKDSSGKVLTTFEVGSGISRDLLIAMIENGLEMLGTEVSA